MTEQTSSLIKFSGHQHFRHRLVLSILSRKSVRIEKIRSEDKNPGLRGKSHPPIVWYQISEPARSVDFEICLLRVLEKLPNGTIIEISITGTQIIDLRVYLSLRQILQVPLFCSNQG
jgi:RNA 3'-terminal phosphate cyclase-like protein